MKNAHQLRLMALGLPRNPDVGDDDVDEVDKAESGDHPGAEHVVGTECIVELEEGEQA